MCGNEAEARAKWAVDKAELPKKGFHFPNLPYMIDGDVKIVQSLAILKHIARKHNLMGNPNETAHLDMMEVIN